MRAPRRSPSCQPAPSRCRGRQSGHTLATCANGAPNVVPVAFKDVTAEGKLVVGDVFLGITPEKVIVATPGADNKKEL